ARRIFTATRLRKICADGNLHESENSTWAEAALVPVALHRRPHHGRGDQRTRISRDRRLRPSACAPAWRTVAAGCAVEVRVQIDRAVQFHRHAPEGYVGGVAGVRIRLLGKRQSGSAASALEPGDRGDYWHRRAAADAPFQWLWRLRRRSLQGSGKRTSLGVRRRPYDSFSPVSTSASLVRQSARCITNAWAARASSPMLTIIRPSEIGRLKKIR